MRLRRSRDRSIVLRSVAMAPVVWLFAAASGPCRGDASASRGSQAQTVNPATGTIYLAGRSLVVDVASGQLTPFPVQGGSLHRARNGESLLLRCTVGSRYCDLLIVARGDRAVAASIRTTRYGGASLDDPILSPDGSMIAFTDFSLRRPGIVVIARDGRELNTFPDLRAADWDSRGNLLAVGFTRTNPGLFAVHPITARVTKLSDAPATSAAIAPDDRHIAFELNERTLMLDLVTRRITALTAEGYNATRPAWSPDGRWIAVLSYVPQRPGKLTEFGGKGVALISPQRQRQPVDLVLRQPNGNAIGSARRITWR